MTHRTKQIRKKIACIFLLAALLFSAVPLLGPEGTASADDSSNISLTTTTVSCSKIKGYFTVDNATLVAGGTVGFNITYDVSIYPESLDATNKVSLKSDPTVTSTSTNVTVSFETSDTAEFQDGNYVIKLTANIRGFSISFYSVDYQQTRAIYHSWNMTSNTPATCTADGLRTSRCSQCGATKTEVIDHFGHNWDSGTVTTPATCSAAGVKTVTCTACGETNTQAIPMTGHKWDSGTVTVAPKYFETGIKRYACTKCGIHKTEIIPKLNAAPVTPAKVKIKSARVSNKKLTLSWKRIKKNTKGYQVSLKNKNTGKVTYYNVKQSKKATLKKVIKKLKKNKTYAVRVRAYNKIGRETIYGPWSKVKSGKVK